VCLLDKLQSVNYKRAGKRSSTKLTSIARGRAIKRNQSVVLGVAAKLPSSINVEDNKKRCCARRVITFALIELLSSDAIPQTEGADMKFHLHKSGAAEISKMEQKDAMARTLSKVKGKGMVMVTVIKNSAQSVGSSNGSSQHGDRSIKSDHFALESDDKGKTKSAFDLKGDENTSESKPLRSEQISKYDFDAIRSSRSGAYSEAFTTLSEATHERRDANNENRANLPVKTSKRGALAFDEVAPFAESWGGIADKSGVPSSILMTDPTIVNEITSPRTVLSSPRAFHLRETDRHASIEDRANLLVKTRRSGSLSFDEVTPFAASRGGIAGKSGLPSSVLMTGTTIVSTNNHSPRTVVSSPRVFHLRGTDQAWNKSKFSDSYLEGDDGFDDVDGADGAETTAPSRSFSTYAQSTDSLLDDDDDEDDDSSRESSFAYSKFIESVKSTESETSMGSKSHISVDVTDFEDDDTLKAANSNVTSLKTPRPTAQKANFFQKLSLGLHGMVDDPLLSENRGTTIREEEDTASLAMTESYALTEAHETRSRASFSVSLDQEHGYKNKRTNRKKDPRTEAKVEDGDSSIHDSCNDEGRDPDEDFWAQRKSSRTLIVPCKEILLQSVLDESFHSDPSMAEKAQGTLELSFDDVGSECDLTDLVESPTLFDTIHTNASVLEGESLEIEVLAKGTTEFVQLAGKTITVHVRRSVVTPVAGPSLAVVMPSTSQESERAPQDTRKEEEKKDSNLDSVASWTSTKSLKHKMRKMYRKVPHAKVPRIPQSAKSGIKSVKEDAKEAWRVSMLLIGCNPYVRRSEDDGFDNDPAFLFRGCSKPQDLNKSWTFGTPTTNETFLTDDFFRPKE
jgi:hypothetical protein